MAFKDVLIASLDGGLYTANEESKIPENYSPDLLNIEFDEGGSVRNRQGSAPLGAAVSSLSGIRSLHTVKRSDGIEIPLRTWSTLIEYYNRQTSAWARLSTGQTADSMWGFADYTDYTYLCDGIDPLWRWNRQYGVVTNTHASSATVIETPSLSNWLSAGEAIVGTMPIYYGSRTSGTLSSITGISAGITANTEIAQAMFSARGWTANVSSTPRGNILLTNADRLYLAGCSAEGTKMYYSRIGDPTDWTYGATHVDNEGGYISASDGGGYITSLASRGRNKIAIFLKNAIKGFQFQSLTDNHLDWPMISDIAESRNSGALNNRGTAGVESATFFISPKGGVRLIGDSLDNTVLQYKSSLIKSTCDDLSFVSASSIYFDNKYYVACRETTSNRNNIVLVNDTVANKGNGAWTRFKGWAVNQWADFDGDLYYADANSKTVYKVGLNYDDDGYLYTSYYKTPLINHGVPQERKRLRYIYLEGYMTKGCKLSCTTYYDALSSNKKQFVLYGNGAYVDTNTTLTFGDSLFADSAFAGDPTGASFILYKFRARLSHSIQDLFNYQFEIKSQQAGEAWRIDAIAPYVERESQDVFPVSNLIGL